MPDNMVTPITISAPGSLMLLGEHAVLHGNPCLVAAIEKRVQVSVLPRNDGLVCIQSALGEYQGSRNDLTDHPSFRFMLAAFRELPDAAPGGLDMVVHADMPPTIGFGTSAAVTAVTLGALEFVSRGAWSMPGLLEHAHNVIRTVQGRGSGADAAASIYGGIVHYRISKTETEVISAVDHPLTALYCGYKTPTPEVIRRVDEQWKNRAHERSELFDQINQTVERGRLALSCNDLPAFGAVLNQGHAHMKTLGVSTPELDECQALLCREKQITGAKISGSGLGDCVVGWGSSSTIKTDYEQYHLTVAPGGIRIE